MHLGIKKTRRVIVSYQGRIQGGGHAPSPQDAEVAF